MKPLQSQEQIDERRRKLYDRGSVVGEVKRHELTDIKVDVSRDWSNQSVPEPEEVKEVDLGKDTLPELNLSEEPISGRPKRHYRTFILLGSVLIFIFVALVSTVYLYFGGNQISSDNIQIAMQGPQLIGGGEVMSFKVGVKNDNSIQMESATLIIRYPDGTRSVGDSPRNLFEERIPLEDIESGSAQEVSVSMVVFGEENAEKKIEATVEYRIDGSNGMFYKDAEPLVFRISSSPLVLRVDNIEKVSSGQLVNIKLTAVSNASTPLNDILISASYPSGFIFESSSPEPVFGQNIWKIGELLPENEVSIVLQGIITGLTNETSRINFSVGPSDPDNQFIIAANLAEAKADFEIEKPFIDVKVEINGQDGNNIVIPEGTDSNVKIEIINTLDETVYDMAVEVVPGGNALTDASIRSNQGFYDSNRGTVRWEVANNESFAEVLPGNRRLLEFEITPGPVKTTASFDLVVNVYARRIAETSAAETLVGTSRTEAKYSASADIGSQADHKYGNIPPKVGQDTTYSITMVVAAGANDVVNAIVDTSLPVYVNWLDNYETDGELTYNSVSKKMQWSVGDVSSGSRKEVTFDVSFTPSVSQVETIPVILNSQSMRANDRFTGALLQDSSPAVTTELSSEMGYEEDNGEVVE